MKKNEQPGNEQDPIVGAEQNDRQVDTENDVPSTNDDPGRRKFLSGGLVTGLAILGVGAGAVALTVPSAKGSAALKSRILARIQEELDNEYMNDPLTYHQSGYDEYVRGS